MKKGTVIATVIEPETTNETGTVKVTRIALGIDPVLGIVIEMTDIATPDTAIEMSGAVAVLIVVHRHALLMVIHQKVIPPAIGIEARTVKTLNRVPSIQDVLGAVPDLVVEAIKAVIIAKIVVNVSERTILVSQLRDSMVTGSPRTTAINLQIRLHQASGKRAKLIRSLLLHQALKSHGAVQTKRSELRDNCL